MVNNSTSGWDSQPEYRVCVCVCVAVSQSGSSAGSTRENNTRRASRARDFEATLEITLSTQAGKTLFISYWNIYVCVWVVINVNKLVRPVHEDAGDVCHEKVLLTHCEATVVCWANRLTVTLALAASQNLVRCLHRHYLLRLLCLKALSSKADH